MNQKEELSEIRQQIDAVDNQIVGLLGQRAALAQKIGKIKGSSGVPVFHPEREMEVIRRAVAANKSSMTGQQIEAVFREIMSACRSLEHKTKVAYLGPRGTFSEMAMLKQFGSSVEGMPCDQIEEVFRATEAGTAQFGVVPIENSSEGSVNRTMDSLTTTSLSIVGECSIPIRHNLLSKSGTMKGITRIYSHPQSFGQCVGWLNDHYPNLPRISVSSNGEAAKMASEDPTASAIAGSAAAVTFGLQIVESHIQDLANNRTRFVILGSQKTEPSKIKSKDKTSLIIAVPHKAGALYHALQPLDDHGVSMTRFESRPAKRGAWEYFFFMDIEGHIKDPAIAVALDDLRKSCSFMKILGSYPIEEDFGTNSQPPTKL